MSWAREEAKEKLLDFILKNFWDKAFTYDDLPSIKELSEEFYREYVGQYGAAEASDIAVLTSVKEMALGELLQSLPNTIEVVGYKKFRLRDEIPINR